MRTTKTIIVAIFLMISGCDSSKPESMLSEYSQRLSTVLETDIQLSALPALPNFPQKRHRTHLTTELRQGLWEVLDFRQCDMLGIISERNSSLGKVMPPSQKMRYELRFLHALQQCQNTLQARDDPDQELDAFKERLDEILTLKLNSLPLEVWNGIYASSEISKQFKTSSAPLANEVPETGSDYAAIHSAMQRFDHLAKLATSKTIELPNWLDDIEDDYAALYRSDLGSQLLTSLNLLIKHLNAVAEAIDRRLSRKPFCFKGHQPPRATVLNNVFRKYYVQQVQPYMARVEQNARPWFTAHAAIIQKLPATPAMKAYADQVFSLQHNNSLWSRWIAARDRHTKAWQTILGQCNMMPNR